MRRLSAIAVAVMWALVIGCVAVGIGAYVVWPDPEDWPLRIVIGLVAAVTGGVAIALGRRREDAVIGPVPDGDLRQVRRAARTGPPPTDPRLREAAARLAVHRLDELTRHRTGQFISFGIAAVCTAGLALRTPEFWLIAAWWAGLLAVEQGWRPGRLRRRIAVLRNEAAPA